LGADDAASKVSTMEAGTSVLGAKASTVGARASTMDAKASTADAKASTAVANASTAVANASTVDGTDGSGARVAMLHRMLLEQQEELTEVYICI